MGCCFSGEEEAKETHIPAPTPGAPLEVRLEKQGMLDADYDVFDVSGGGKAQWMLIDTVGGIFTGGLKYFLKHRIAGSETSTVLGAAQIHGSDTEFKYKITDEEVDYDVGFDSDRDDMWSDDGDSDREFMDDLEFEIKHKLKAKWKLEKQCDLFSDYEMTNRIGKLKVKAKGKYKRKTKTEIKMESYTDEEGHEKTRKVTEKTVKHKTKLKQFYYKMEVMNTKICLEVERNSGGASFWRRGHEWRGTSETGAELFRVIGDGRNCTVKTCPGSDPSSTLLAAFAVACKFDPSEVQSTCEGMCASRIHS